MGIGAFVAPGVYTSERDMSQYIPALATTQFGIVTTASKGPLDTRQLIGSEDQLINTFGIPSPTHIGLHAARQYLHQGNQLTVVRVGSYSCATAQQSSNPNTVVEPPDHAVITFEPTSPGTWASGSNGLQVVVATSNVRGYKIRVYWRGYLQETYDAVVLTADDPDLIDTRMANSAYVTAITLNHSGALTNGTVYFAGGDDGENVTESDVIGSVVGTTKTGLQLFSNAEEYDLNLLAVPGDSRKGVIAELLGIAEDRQDCMVLIDPPYGLDVDGIIKWHNGLGGGADDPTSALDSSYGSLTWPWVQTYDSWTDANIWTPPSGWVAGLMAASDANYEVWFATSGFRRGNLVGALDIEYSPNQGERTQLCGRSGTGGFNAINPFVKFSGQGIKRFDCLTLQRAATALNLEPVRRMLTYLRKMIATSSMYLLFEQNDWRLWTRFKNMVEPYLKSVQAREGLRDSLVVMDATTNTDDIIEQGICAGRIVLKPIKPDRIIQLTFVLTPQGANFTEYVV